MPVVVPGVLGDRGFTAVYPVADGDDDDKAIEIHLARNRTKALGLDYANFSYRCIWFNAFGLYMSCG